jgi:hypothetical protein
LQEELETPMETPTPTPMKIPVPSCDDSFTRELQTQAMLEEEAQEGLLDISEFNKPKPSSN